MWFSLCAGCTTSNNPWPTLLPSPHPPVLLSLFSDEEERKKTKMRAMWTAGHWDKARPLLTCPRPSPRILPPTSIDYVVGGREAGLIIFFSPPPLSSFPMIPTAPQAACLVLSPPLPNDIFAINGRLHGSSIIWPRHNQWRSSRRMGHFLRKQSFIVSSPAVRRYFFSNRPLRVVVRFSHAKKPVGGAGARSCSAPPN